MLNLLIRGSKNFLKIAFLLLLFSSGLNAQNIILKDLDGKTITNDTIEVVFHPTADHGWTELVFRVFLKNNSNDTIESGFIKKEFNLQKDEYHSFCFAGNCVDSSIHVSPYHAVIPPGGTDSSFSGHYRFDDILHVKSKCLVSYTFYDVKNNSDTAIVWVIYNTLLQTAINEFSKGDVLLSDAFPNPVNETLHLNYNLKNTSRGFRPFLIVKNSLGEFMQKQLLTEETGSISINTANWKPGVYYYFVSMNNNPIAFKKCIIVH